MIHQPLFIIGCPRSGTTLLYNILSELPELWSIGAESKAIIEKYHHPSQKNWDSGILMAADVTPVSCAYIPEAFYQQAAPGAFWRRVNQGRSWLRGNRLWQRMKQRGRTKKSGGATSSTLPQQGMQRLQQLVALRNRLERGRPAGIRLLEKTPENCLRLPFLLDLFPDAQIIYLVRDGRNNINSLIEGWQQPHLFPGYQVPEPLHIPGYSRPRWAFTLIPGWRDLANHPLAEVCAWQWMRCNEFVLQHREESDGRVPYLTLHYESLIADTVVELRRLADFIGVAYEPVLSHHAASLPRINVVSAPTKEKWRGMNEQAITEILPLIAPMMAQLGYDSSS